MPLSKEELLKLLEKLGPEDFKFLTDLRERVHNFVEIPMSVDVDKKTVQDMVDTLKEQTFLNALIRNGK